MEIYNYWHSKYAIFSPVALRSLCIEHAIPQMNNKMRNCILISNVNTVLGKKIFRYFGHIWKNVSATVTSEYCYFPQPKADLNRTLMLYLLKKKKIYEIT